MKSTKIAIIGAGVAGTCMAHFLKSNSISYTIYEKNSCLNDNGLGFLIMSNGLKILQEMGLKDEISKKGNYINHYCAVNQLNKITIEKNIEDCLIISREHFLKTIRTKTYDDDIILNSKIKSVQFDSCTNQSVIEFEDRHSENFDLVIGADGIHSQMRNFVLAPENKPNAGYKEIVGKIVDENIFNICGHSFNKFHNKEKGFNMGVLATNENNVIWFIQFDTRKNTLNGIDKKSMQALALEITKDAPEFFKSIIENYNIEDAYLWNLLDVDVAKTFTNDGIVLIGDAAHPLLSFTSQGVNSALEDAQLLSEILIDSIKNKIPIDYEKFNSSRKKSIQFYIDEGRELMDRFLYPEKYDNEKEPFIQN